MTLTLTRGQRRRRAMNYVRAAISSLPTWIILMGLLFSGGKPLFKGGALAMGTCADCCGPNGCSDCPSSCFLCDGSDPNAPTTWHVTFFDVDVAMPCTYCYTDAFGNDNYLASWGSLGTYTLHNGDGPGTHFNCTDGGNGACQWHETGFADSPDPATCFNAGAPLGPPNCHTAYVSHTAPETDCLTVPFGRPELFNNFTVLCKDTGTFTLTVWAIGVGDFSLEGTFFQSTISSNACCSSHDFTNANTAYSCGTLPAAGDGVFGKNGTAVVTVC